MSMLSAFLVSQRSWFPGMQSHAWFLLVHAGHSKSTTHSCRASVITIRVISPIMNSFFIFKCIQFNNVIRVAPVMASVLRLFPDLIDQISFVAINLSKQLKNTFTSRSTVLNTLFLTVWVFTCAYPHRHTHVHIKKAECSKVYLCIWSKCFPLLTPIYCKKRFLWWGLRMFWVMVITRHH